MAKQYLADTVDVNRTVYPTIGENIRHSVTPENISNSIKNNTDRAKICDSLDVTAEDLKTAIINLLTGNTAYFGGLDTDALSSSQLAQIKTYLGIS